MIQLYSYRIPFRRPFITAGESFDHREGLLMAVQRDNLICYGEIAPLPGFSAETLQDATHQTRRFIDDHRNLLEDGSPVMITQSIEEYDLLASVRYGFDMLVLDMMAKMEQCSISEVLGLEVNSTLRCNGVVGSGSAEAIHGKVSNLVKRGYSTLKFKVGGDHHAELSVIARIRKQYPQIKIRLDANQAWQVDEAISKLSDFAKYHIQYCEQPVIQHDLTGLGKVKEISPILIAADEAADSVSSAKVLIEEDHCDILIIKPMVFGSVNELIVTKTLADTHNKQIVFTTSLESVIGRTMTAELAAGLGTSTLAHGLSTGELLREQVVKQEVTNGDYRSNRGPGLDVEPDLTHHRLIN